jgi:hypothetical protein
LQIEISESLSQIGSVKIEMVEQISNFTVDAAIKNVQGNNEYLFQTSFVNSVSYLNGDTIVVAYFVGFNKEHNGTIGLLHQFATWNTTSSEPFSLKKMPI